MLLLMDEVRRTRLAERRIGDRAIGVMYNPALERYGNYVPSIVTDRYDAFLSIDKTRALYPRTFMRMSTRCGTLSVWQVLMAPSFYLARMAEDKKRDDLTVFGKDTDTNKTPEPIEQRSGDGGPGEREMNQQIQDEEIKEEQNRAASE